MELLEPTPINFSTPPPQMPPPRFTPMISLYDLESGLREEKEKIVKLQQHINILYERVPPIWANIGIYVLLFIKDTCFAICIVIIYYKVYSNL